MPKKEIILTRQTARRLAIAKQHLSGKRRPNPGPNDILDLVKDMSYVQLDPTNAVAPSHLLVLHSRLGAFRESDLDRLLWKEKKLFEYWAHVASIVLMEDYPLYLPRMKGFHKGNLTWDVRLREWMNQNKPLRAHVLHELRSKGPLSLRDFEDHSEGAWVSAREKWGLKPSAWSEERSVSRMVQFLFHDGTIMVSGRQGRQKVYDLTERFLPGWAPKKELTEMEVEYIGAQKSLKGLGVATPKQIAWHFLQRRYPHMKETAKKLVADGRFVPVKLTDAPSAKGHWLIHADDVELAGEKSGSFEPRTTLLSPFDNLISDRDRTHLLFDFFFRLEIYTPKEKRIHGFFVLPVLDGDRIVGRVDPTMDRETERLVVNAVHAEPNVPRDKGLGRRISSSIDDLATFLGAKEVTYAGKVPDAWKSALR